MKVIDGELVGSRALKFLDYVDKVGQGDIVSRRDMCARMQAPYSTVVYNLERAVSEGYLNKQYGFASADQPGWLYALPGTMPNMKGF